MFPIFRTTIDWKFPHQLGRLPDNSLFERSKILVNPLFASHRKDLQSVNLLLERYKLLAFDREGGIEPWNWLKLKSMSKAYISGKYGKALLRWLKDIFKYLNSKVILLNQLGTKPEILELEMSRWKRFDWVWSQLGNYGPK